MRRQASALDVDEFGVDVPIGSAEGFDAMGRERAMQRRRELPSVPTNVPVPVSLVSTPSSLSPMSILRLICVPSPVQRPPHALARQIQC